MILCDTGYKWVLHVAYLKIYPLYRPFASILHCFINSNSFAGIFHYKPTAGEPGNPRALNLQGKGARLCLDANLAAKLEVYIIYIFGLICFS